MSSPLGEFVKSARAAKGLSQKGLADLAGVSPKQVQNVEAGENTSIEFLAKLAPVLEVTEFPVDAGVTMRTVETLRMNLGDAFQIIDPSPRVVRKRVEAFVAAGHGGWDEAGDDWVDVPERLVGPDDFLVQAKGESMVDEGISDGDFVLVTRVSPNIAPTGDIVIAWLNDGLVIKRWGRRNGRGYLFSANPDWGEREITESDSFQIQGIVKLFWRNPKRKAAEFARAVKAKGKR